jgi:hypothetical protein
MTPVVIEIYDEHDKNIYTEDLGTIATVAVPLVVAILLGLRFMKKGCKSPRT